MLDVVRWIRYLLIHNSMLSLYCLLDNNNNDDDDGDIDSESEWKKWSSGCPVSPRYHFHIAISSVRLGSLAEPSAMFYQSLVQLFCVQINRSTNRPTNQPFSPFAFHWIAFRIYKSTELGKRRKKNEQNRTSCDNITCFLLNKFIHWNMGS